MVHKYKNEDKVLAAVDCIIFGFDQKAEELKLLLIKRDFDPEKGKWSLMGAFVNQNESTDEAATLRNSKSASATPQLQNNAKCTLVPTLIGHLRADVVNLAAYIEADLLVIGVTGHSHCMSVCSAVGQIVSSRSLSARCR